MCGCRRPCTKVRSRSAPTRTGQIHDFTTWPRPRYASRCGGLGAVDAFSSHPGGGSTSSRSKMQEWTFSNCSCSSPFERTVIIPVAKLHLFPVPLAGYHNHTDSQWTASIMPLQYRPFKSSYIIMLFILVGIPGEGTAFVLCCPCYLRLHIISVYQYQHIRP